MSEAVSSKKRFSINSEVLALFTLCHNGTEAANQCASLLLGSLNADHFVTPIGETVYSRIKYVLRNRGDLPDIEDMFEDPGLSKDIRRALRNYRDDGVRGLKNLDRVSKLFHRLDQYRKIRALFSIGIDLENKLHSDKVDPDAIIEALAVGLTNASKHTRGMTVASRGDGNTTLKIAKDILRGNGIAYVPTGIKAFDNESSGIPRGAFMIIGATTGGGKCITGDSLVYTSDGLLTMKELWDLRKGAPIGQGFYALNTSVRNHLDATERAKGIFSKMAKTRRIEMDYGLNITGTDEHRMWTYNTNTLSYAFKSLKDLRLGDWLPRTVTPGMYGVYPCRNGVSLNLDIDWTRIMKSHYKGKNPTFPTSMPTYLNKEMAGVMGYMIAEGSGNKVFHNIDEEILSDYTKRYKKLFGIIPTPKTKKGKVHSLRNCAIVSDFLELNGIPAVTSSFKQVPLKIRQSSLDVQAEFLRCLFEGDGYISRAYRISYSTVSKTLATHVTALLDNMGIKTYLRVKHGLKTKRLDAQTGYNVVIHSHSILKFAELVGFVGKFKSKRLKEYCKNPRPSNTSCVPAALLARQLGNIIKKYLMSSVDPLDVSYINRLSTDRLFTKDYILRFFDVLDKNKLNYKLGQAIGRHNLDLPKNVLTLLKDLLRQDWVQVTSNQPTGKTEQVYDLMVPNGSSYQVNGLLSHNSTAISQIAENMALQGARVGVVPLEMNNTEMVMRDLARASGVSLTDLAKPRDKMSVKMRKSAYRAYKERTLEIDKRGGCIKLIEPGGDVDIQTLLAEAKPFDLDVIFIDYIGLLKGAEGDAQWRELQNISRYCKVWAGMTGVTVIMAAQVADEGNIRYSGGITENASYAWTWVKDELSEATNIYKIKQKKSRQSRSFDFYVYIDSAHMTFRDVTKEELANYHDFAADFRPTNGGKEGMYGKKRTPDKKSKQHDYSNDDDDDEAPKKKKVRVDHGGGAWSPTYSGKKGGKKSNSFKEQEF